MSLSGPVIAASIPGLVPPQRASSKSIRHLQRFRPYWIAARTRWPRPLPNCRAQQVVHVTNCKDNGRALQTFFQMVRLRRYAHKGLSSSMERAFQRWLNEASVGKVLSASIVNDPSLLVLQIDLPTLKDNWQHMLFSHCLLGSFL